MSLSILKKMRSSLIFKTFEVVLHFQIYLRSSSILKKFEVVFDFEKIEVVFHFQNRLRSSSIFKNIEVVFHVSSRLVILKLPPRLPVKVILFKVGLGCGNKGHFHKSNTNKKTMKMFVPARKCRKYKEMLENERKC